MLTELMWRASLFPPSTLLLMTPSSYITVNECTSTRICQGVHLQRTQLGEGCFNHLGSLSGLTQILMLFLQPGPIFDKISSWKTDPEIWEKHAGKPVGVGNVKLPSRALFPRNSSVYYLNNLRTCICKAHTTGTVLRWAVLGLVSAFTLISLDFMINERWHTKEILKTLITYVFRSAEYLNLYSKINCLQTIGGSQPHLQSHKSL